MSQPATRVWTEFRPRFGLVVAALVAGGVLLGVDSGLSRVVFGVVLVAAVATSLTRDGYAGVVIGLAGAGLLVLVARLTDALTQRTFFLVGTEVATVLATAWLVGILGNHLRTSVDRATRSSAGAVRPASTLMGVLGADVGLHRLDEEIVRRRSTGGALGLALVSHDPLHGESDTAEPARRAIARHIEAAVDDTAVVFAVDDATLAVILPAADRITALETLGRVAVAASHATYADPVDRERRSVGDLVRLRTALVQADDRTADSRSLLEAAREALAADGHAA